MIYFGVSLRNPFVAHRFSCIWNPHGEISKNKTWELQFSRSHGLIFSFTISTHFKQSHAGYSVELGLFGYIFQADIYDNRHWDYTNDKWETPSSDGC